jgi:4-hydroxy-3-methylbut-2-enyl diphosphate reductase
MLTMIGRGSRPPDVGGLRDVKIILANPRGFCAGVNMAIESLERCLDLFGAPLFVYHEIVHNKYVVERFRQRGVVFVEDLEQVPEGAPLLYSAHGVSPQIRDQARRRRLQASTPPAPWSPRSTSRRSSTPARATRSS